MAQIAQRWPDSIRGGEYPGLTVFRPGGIQAATTTIEGEKGPIVGETYTSTGVRPPWVREQQTAPARANRE